jgi:farnesyl-diphosphate farnesyltransferase
MYRYKSIIIDICLKMETGMADFAHKAATTGSIYLDAVADYDLYCHYVAGLVGEGLSRIWSASGKEASFVGEQLVLSNSMGLLLQKTNIIRDYREDVDDSRFFWPREIWGDPKYGFTEMKDMYQPGSEQRAQWVQSAMVLDALRHATDSLDYLRLLKNQSVFNFCAIPAAMAMATLALCFGNPEMFKRNIKIRKAEAASVSFLSTCWTSLCQHYSERSLCSSLCGRRIQEKSPTCSGNLPAKSITKLYRLTPISSRYP